jgi:5'-nucleotidase
MAASVAWAGVSAEGRARAAAIGETHGRRPSQQGSLVSLLLALLSLLASPLCHAHLLNMTKVVASLGANGQVTVDMQVDLTRGAGGPLEYYRLSRVETPKSDAEIGRLMDRLAGAIDVRLGGTAVPLHWETVELPKLSQEEFVNPLNWPMTHVTLKGILPEAADEASNPAEADNAAEAATTDEGASPTLAGVFRPSFPFEEPISLTFSAEHDQRTMTRWLVANQSSPAFPLKEGSGSQPAATVADNGGLFQYIVFGFTHILPRGLDHMLFVLGLYLGARSFRSLLLLVTCFTLAHSITLALAAVGAVRLPASIVEPLIAASIVWVGIENFFVHRTGRWRPIIVFLFGLLHGLGFASALSELQLPAGNFLLALLSFNVGIELGQLAVIALAFAATAVFLRKPWYRSRMALPASVAIAILATFWTVERASAATPAPVPVPAPTSAPAASAAPITVKLIAFNDFHGQLLPPARGTSIVDPHEADPRAPGSANLVLPTGGVAWLATLISQLKSQNPLNAVVAGGDLIGASPLESALFHDEPTIEALGAAGLEFSSVGNHEFDEGAVELQRIQHGGCRPKKALDSCRHGRFKGASFKYLAANVFDTTTNKTLFPPYAIKTLKLPSGKALRIGFVGAVVKSVPNLVVASGIQSLRFEDEATSVNALVPTLRAKGADLIVLLIHEGGDTSAKRFDDATCPDFTGYIIPILDHLDPAVSVVVSAHTHNTYICHRNGRLVTSAGSQGRYLTDIDVTLDGNDRHVISSTARQVAVVNDLGPNPLPAQFPTLTKNAKVDGITKFYLAEVAPVSSRVIAELPADITRERSPAGESALGDLVADAQLAATSPADAGGAQIAFMNRDGVRADLVAHKGHVTYGDLYTIHPFGNTLTTITLTGAQIHALLEQQWLDTGGVLYVSDGFSYAWSSAAAPGSRVEPGNIKLKGVPIDPAGRYRVTANNFMIDGGDGFKVLKEGTDRTRGVLDTEALEKYLVSHSPVKAPPGGRIQVK